jgi:hypothetical protein
VSHTTVATTRDELEARGQIGHVSTTTDTLGRKQPARKRKRCGAKPDGVKQVGKFPT